MGNSNGEQSDRFTNAFANVKTFLTNAGYSVMLEHQNLKTMREEKLTAKTLVDWLLGSHIHFVITHPHQGMESATAVSVVQLYREFARLKYHFGFPCGEQLQCPIFSQDKWNYLRHIPATLPTCKLVVEELEEGMMKSVNYSEMFPLTVAKIKR